MFATTQSGGRHVAMPDVCLTPTPHGAPVPVAYCNAANPAMGVSAAEHVLFCNAPAHHLGTSVPITQGSEAGRGRGVTSKTVMGGSRALTAASTVLTDGIPAARLGSVTLANSTNCPGATIAPSQLKVVLLAR